MKRIRKNKDINSYFLGGLIDKATGQLNKLGNAVGAGLDLGNGLIPSSGNAKTDAITGGIATGLETVGSAFGPIGSVVGKAAGMLTKGIGAMVGTSDSVNTDTGEYIEGKGIKGRRSRNRVRAQWRRVNQGIADANATAAAQEEWANEYGDNDYSLAAYGGILPTTLAYLDDGELMRTPDGEISQIPEQGKPTDSNLVNVPVGTQVLSDKLKVPGTNETFAQAGKKYMKTGKKKGNDIYAQNTQMLNDRNNQKKYNELLALQEQVKAKRGIKNKVGKYAGGTPGLPEPVTSAEDRDEMNQLFIRVNPNYNSNISHDRNRAATSWYKSADANAYKQAGESIRTFLKNKDNYDNAYKTLSGLPQIQKNLKTGMSFEDAVVKNVQDGLYGQVHDYFDISSTPFTDEANSVAPVRSRSSFSHNIEVPISGQNYSVQNKIGDHNFTNNYIYTGPGKINIPKRNTNPNNGNDRSYGSLFDILTNGAALIGPMANIYNSDPEKARVFTYSPHFAPVDYDISPILREIDMTNAIARYNANQAGGFGRSANLAQAVQSQVARNRAIAQAYNQKNNIENERKARNIGIYNDWARYNTEAFHRGYEEDAQNRAAARTIRNTGLSQLGTALQSMSRDNRLNNRDQAMLEYMKEFFNYGSTQDTVNKLYRNFR